MNNPENLRPDAPDQPVILLADDEVVVRNVIRVTLERQGYFLLVADDGQEALTLSRRYPGEIHLLLSDIQMPMMNGIELSQQIRTERPSIRIVLMSGHSEETAHGLPFLHKPFVPQTLIETIQGVLPAKTK